MVFMQAQEERCKVISGCGFGRHTSDCRFNADLRKWLELFSRMHVRFFWIGWQIYWSRPWTSGLVWDASDLCHLLMVIMIGVGRKIGVGVGERNLLKDRFGLA